MKNNKKKGFTLIEFLVVIAIIAILAVVVVLTLNPAELLRQARDSNRVSDFATFKSAIGCIQRTWRRRLRCTTVTDTIYLSLTIGATRRTSSYLCRQHRELTALGIRHSTGVNAACISPVMTTTNARSISGTVGFRSTSLDQFGSTDRTLAG